MPEYNELLYKYLNYCLGSIGNEIAKCEFVMRLNKLIARMPDTADKKAIVKFTQDYFIPRDEKQIDLDLIATRKGAMQSLINGYAAAWTKRNKRAPLYLQEYADLLNCKNLVMNSVFGKNKDNVYLQDMDASNYDLLNGKNSKSYKIQDKEGFVVNFSESPAPGTFDVMNKCIKKLDKKIKKNIKKKSRNRDQSLIATFSTHAPKEALFNQTELLALDVKLQEIQNVINPEKEFKYQDNYVNDKVNILKELSNINFFTEQAKKVCFDLKGIVTPHLEHYEYRKQQYERERDEYMAMQQDLDRQKREYEAEKKQPLSKSTKKNIYIPKKMKKALLQSGLKRLTAKKKLFKKAKFEYKKRRSKLENPSAVEASFIRGYGSLQYLISSCFDEKNGFKRQDISLSDLRTYAKAAYQDLDDYISKTSLWNPKYWGGENRTKLSAAKHAKSYLSAIITSFGILEEKGIHCSPYTLMADGTIQKDLDNTKQTIQKNAIEYTVEKSDVSKKTDQTEIKTQGKAEKAKNTANNEEKNTINVNTTPKIKNVFNLKASISAPDNTSTNTTHVDPFEYLTPLERKNARILNRKTEFLVNYKNVVKKYSSLIPNFEKRLNSNDIEVLNKLINNDTLKNDIEVKRYLDYRIDKLKILNDVINKAEENMQNRKVENAKISPELIMVDNVLQPEMQHTGNGCWSVALSALLKHRGVDLAQNVIRAYRPDATKVVGDNTFNFDSPNQISSYTGMIQEVLPNTAVNEASYSQHAVNRMWSKTETNDQVKKCAEKMKETLKHALKEANGPVALLVGNHYRTIYGFKEDRSGDIVYLNDPMDSTVKSKKLHELANGAITHIPILKDGKEAYSDSCTFTVSWLTDLKNEKGVVQYSPRMNNSKVTYDKDGKLQSKDSKVNDLGTYVSFLTDNDSIIKDVGFNTFLPKQLKDIQLKKDKEQAKGNVSNANNNSAINRLSEGNAISKTKTENKPEVQRVLTSYPLLVEATLTDSATQRKHLRNNNTSQKSTTGKKVDTSKQKVEAAKTKIKATEEKDAENKAKTVAKGKA